VLVWLRHRWSHCRVRGRGLLCDPGAGSEHRRWFRGTARSWLCGFLCYWFLCLGDGWLNTVRLSYRNSRESPGLALVFLANVAWSCSDCGSLRTITWRADAALTRRLPGYCDARLRGDCTGCL